MSGLLLDTHLLVWTVASDPRLPGVVRQAIEEGRDDIAYSVASLWEIAIKAAPGRGAFPDPAKLREALLQAEFAEIDVRADHALASRSLPALHGDPFDRLLLAQAEIEGRVLLTSDRILARYPGPVRLVI